MVWCCTVSLKKLPVHSQKEIVYSCDYAIVTMPLGFLKREHANIFVPQLPSEKNFAIERLGFGCVNKLFIVFERAVLKERHLREGVNFLEILWRDDLQFELNSNIKWNLKVCSRLISTWLYSRRFNYHKPLEEWNSEKVGADIRSSQENFNFFFS